MLSIQMSLLTGSPTSRMSESYVVAVEGTTGDKNGNTTIIHENDFGDYVLTFVKDKYKTDFQYTDSELANTFTYTVRKGEETDTSCQLIATLTSNVNAEYSKLETNQSSDQSSDQSTNTNTTTNGEITEENADYVIKLKVGQVCNIQTNGKINGYSVFGDRCVSFSEDYKTITATVAGRAYGYLMFSNEERKSVYYIVEENTNNESLDPISVTIAVSSSNQTNTNTANPTNTPTTSNTAGTQSSNNTANSTQTATKNDSTVATTTIPQTGSAETMIFLIALAILISLVWIFKRKRKEYQDIP